MVTHRGRVDAGQHLRAQSPVEVVVHRIHDITGPCSSSHCSLRPGLNPAQGQVDLDEFAAQVDDSHSGRRRTRIAARHCPPRSACAAACSDLMSRRRPTWPTTARWIPSSNGESDISSMQDPSAAVTPALEAERQSRLSDPTANDSGRSSLIRVVEHRFADDRFMCPSEHFHGPGDPFPRAHVVAWNTIPEEFSAINR